MVYLAALGPLAAAAGAASGAGEFHVSPDLHEILQIPEHGRTYQIMMVLFQLSAILVAAKLLGWLAERVRVPGVIGELLAGAIIGPYLLGQWIRIPLHGHWVSLFPHPQDGQWPVNEILWSFAQFASIILLFITGLHTDLKQFLKYVGPATLVAVVGIAAPFLLGVGTVYIPFFADLARPGAGESVLVPALFVGAILAATSIGITARVLSDIEQLDTPEGVTILGAAVLDDVLGIIALAIVGGIASSGTVSFADVGWISFKAIGVWVALTGVILALAKHIERLFNRIRYAGALVGLGLALAFVCSGIAESFGLAFIIGAYSVGLGLSRTAMAHRLMDELRSLSDFVVPVFFACLGMLVNFEAMFSDWRVVVFGLVVTAAAIVGKLVGCGLAALPAGFNARGAYRIGLGMMPRGEVALIVAGIGLSRNLIGENVFGVSIMMTLITTIVAPILLVPAFATGGSGRKRPADVTPKLPSVSQLPGIMLHLPPDLCEPFLHRLLQAAQSHGWEGTYERADQKIYLLRNRGDAAQVQLDANNRIIIDASDSRQPEFATMVERVRESVSTDMTPLPAANRTPLPAAAAHS